MEPTSMLLKLRLLIKCRGLLVFILFALPAIVLLCAPAFASEEIVTREAYERFAASVVLILLIALVLGLILARRRRVALNG